MPSGAARVLTTRITNRHLLPRAILSGVLDVELTWRRVRCSVPRSLQRAHDVSHERGVLSVREIRQLNLDAAKSPATFTRTAPLRGGQDNLHQPATSAGGLAL